MSTAQHKTLEDFIQLQNRNAISHAIRAGVEIGVIRALRKGQRTLEQLADELDANVDILRRLMTVLVTTELIEKYGDDFAISQVGRLTPDQFLDLGDQHWKHLTKHVRSGSSLPANDDVPFDENDYLRNKASEEWMLTPAAMAAAELLDLANLRKGFDVLEIGCGSAVFGVTIVHGDPECKLTLLDHGSGIGQARQTVKSVELEARVTLIESESWHDLDSINELSGKTFDLILVTGQIHRMTPEGCLAFLKRVHHWVKPEGELAIVDIFPGQEKGDTHRALFELELGLRSSDGSLISPETLKAWLIEAGFGRVQYSHLPAAPYYWGLMLAQR